MSDFTEAEQRLAVALHDAKCSDHRCEPHVFAGEFPVARRLLASDWMKAHDAEVAAATAERIAQELEGMGDTWGGDRMWMTTGTHVATLTAEFVRTEAVSDRG